MTLRGMEVLANILFGVAALTLFFFMIVTMKEGMQEQVRFSEEQNAYLRLVELGLPKWQMSCALVIGRAGGDYTKVERQCSANFPQVKGSK